MVRTWKSAATALMLTILLALLPGRAGADCVMLSPQAQVAQAELIVYGKVTAVDERAQETFFTVTPELIYKGTPINPVIVRTDSGRNRATSIDYPMKLNETHTLYLRVGEGYYTTNSCTASHPGPVRADEAKLLGAGQAPPPPDPKAEPFEPRPWVAVAAMVIAFGALGVVLVSVRRRKKV